MLFILLLCLVTTVSAQEFKGKPTSKGISEYIKTNEQQFIWDFQNVVGDTLDDVYLEVDNLSTYYQHDSLELGCFYLPNEIIITNEELFVEYRLKNLSKFRKNSYRESNQFVYAVVMHELMHFYFYQLIREAKFYNMEVDVQYSANLRMFPVNNYGADFIEEGLCECLAAKMGEIIAYGEYKPDKLDLINNRNSYEVKYRYASQYVSSIVDSLGYRQAILLLIRNKPPSTEEILDKEKFISRLR